MKWLIIEYYTKHDVDAVVEYGRGTDHGFLRFEDVFDVRALADRMSYQGPAEPDRRLGAALNRLGTLLVNPKRGFQMFKEAYYHKPDINGHDVRRRAIINLTVDEYRDGLAAAGVEGVIIPHEFHWLNNVVTFTKRLGLPLVWLHKEACINPMSASNQRAASFRCDVMCCPGEDMREIWSKKPGIDLSRLTVTGFPRFDYYQQRDRWPSREALCRRHGLDPKKKILFFPSFSPMWRTGAWDKLAYTGDLELPPAVLADDISTATMGATLNFTAFRREILTTLVRLALRHPFDLQVVVKLYPTQKRIRFRDAEMVSFLERLGGWGVIPNYRLIAGQEDPRDFAIHADLLVAHNCTMLLEGLLLGTPTLTPKWGEAARPGLIPYAEWNTMPVARSPKALQATAEEILYRGHDFDQYRAGRERIVRRYLHAQDGRATARVFEVLDQVADAARTGRPVRLARAG